MQKLICALLTLVNLSFNLIAQTETVPKSSDSLSKSEIYTIVEQNAEFPGGISEMSKFIMQNLQYPAAAREAGISGRCFLKFIVNENGKLSDIVVLKGVPNCAECDTEALRLIKSMPLWNPGKMKGKAVKMYYTLPLVFNIQ